MTQQLQFQNGCQWVKKMGLTPRSLNVLIHFSLKSFFDSNRSSMSKVEDRGGKHEKKKKITKGKKGKKALTNVVVASRSPEQ